jgi:hypothetical protein
MRVGVGAVVSIGDTVSDVLMVVSFLSSGRIGAAYGTIAMVGLNMLLQIVVTVAQTKHRGWLTVAYEVGIVLCFLKPPVDAYRVASGQQQEQGDPIDPMNMLAIGKGLEMVGEAIPALILQSAILMAIADRSMVAVVSVVLSCFAIAYTSTTIAYDEETNPTKRRNNPEFYGYSLFTTFDPHRDLATPPVHARSSSCTASELRCLTEVDLGAFRARPAARLPRSFSCSSSTRRKCSARRLRWAR